MTEGYIGPFLCYGDWEAAWLSYFQIFWSIDNLDLRSYGQLLSLFLDGFYPIDLDPPGKCDGSESLVFIFFLK